MFNLIKDKKIFIGGCCILVLLIVFIIIYYFYENDDVIESSLEKIATTNESIDNFYVDVKGAVKDPGVYLVNDGDRVIDAITLAGGLKKNASTSNINLSQRLKSEMVIFVYTNSEIKSKNIKSECNTECNCEVIEVNNCIDSENKTELININTANIDDLMTLSGVGESKAESIINYREENGDFKSIEDIKNVSGIGDALFEIIKDKITI